MPTPPVASENTKKNRPNNQRDTETDEEGKMTRESVSLVKPQWLQGRAKRIWYQKVEKAKEFELLDDLDVHTLAVFCDTMAKYEDLARKAKTEKETTQLQAWARIIIQYSEKLGFTPGSRTRLAKKKAEKAVDPFAKDFG